MIVTCELLGNGYALVADRESLLSPTMIKNPLSELVG